MRPPRLKPRFELDSLKSAVARNIFVLFVLCTMVPLAAIGYISLNRAANELELQALTRLRFVSKATGMLIMDRLIFLDAELASMAAEPSHLHPRRSEPSRPASTTALKTAFVRVFTRPIDSEPAAEASPAAGLKLDAEARKRLLDGGSVIFLQPRAGRQPSIIMVRAVTGGRRPRQALFAEINKDYLWRAGVGLSEDGGFAVSSADGRLLTSTFPGAIPWERTREPTVTSSPSIGFKFERGGTEYFASHWTLFMRAQFSTPDWTILQIQTRSSILGPLAVFKLFLPRGLLLVFCLVTLVSLRQIGRTLRPIERLREATRRVGKGDFDARVEIHSRDEFHELGVSFNRMTERLREHFETMATINAIGRSLSLERSNEALLQGILAGAMQVTKAEIGLVYLAREESALELVLLRHGPTALPLPHETRRFIPLQEVGGGPPPCTPASQAAITRQTVNVSDIDACGEYDPALKQSLDETLGRKLGSALAVPLKNHDGEILGVLELASEAPGPPGRVRAFTQEDERLVESLASQAAVAYAKNRMIVELKVLFESLIELIAKAIDEKSPYTGDHCRRVPILAMMLADAACRTQEGNLKRFTLSEEETEELKIAALLHDCGKVTTPVHIVDKATKLETIFDRINLVDARFEVLRRDAEIEHLRRNGAAGGGDPEDAPPRSEELEAVLQRLEEDRRFLRQCNVGTEYMDPDNIERIRAIAGRYGWRNPEGRHEPILSEDEIHNLSVTKGTLTDEDRAIIKHHVVATINMLEALPYPRYLRNVPRYAGAHHERLDGSGYPRGLRAEDLDTQARIIAIADVFEALTASDRPYKAGMMISDALAALRALVDQGEIDGDLVDAFIKERVFLRYAEQYLDPSQIDDEYLAECSALFPRD